MKESKKSVFVGTVCENNANVGFFTHVKFWIKRFPCQQQLNLLMDSMRIVTPCCAFSGMGRMLGREAVSWVRVPSAGGGAWS